MGARTSDRCEPRRRMVTGSFTLTPLDSGTRTRFSWSEKLTFPWWLGGYLGEFLGGKLILKFIWRRNLRALKLIVESAAR